MFATQQQAVGTAVVRIADIAGGGALATSPVWAAESQFWAVWLTAIAGGIVALLRVPPAWADFCAWRRRRRQRKQGEKKA